jgi:hypothetical protein
VGGILERRWAVFRYRPSIIQMKRHPESVFLIEYRNAIHQIVERGTTWHGLQRGEMPVLAGFGKLQDARASLKLLKRPQAQSPKP